MDHNSPGKPTPQQLGPVMVGDAERPSLPTFEGIPVDIRVTIYNYILINNTNISLRSASEMRSQLGPSGNIPSLPAEIWHYAGLPDMVYMYRSVGSRGAPPVDCAPQFTLPQNIAILFVSRKINQEATHIFCADNNFHYSCMRSFPGATIDLLRNMPWPVPFSGMQLYFMKSLSLDYCNSHYNHWTAAAVDDIDNCIARNIIHISEACPSLKAFSLYIFSRPPLTARFHARLGTGQAALALSNLRKRLDWLNLVSTWPDSAVAVFGESIASGAAWQQWQLKQSGLPEVTISEWQLVGVAVRRNNIHVSRLDCKKAMENEEIKCGDAGSEDAENGGSQTDADPNNDDETYEYDGSVFGSG